MDFPHDPDYSCFLRSLRVHGDWCTLQIWTEGSSAPFLFTYEEEEPIDVVKPRRKRTRGGESQIESAIEEPGFDRKSGNGDPVVIIENEQKTAFFDREAGKGETDDMVITESRAGFTEIETDLANESVIARIVSEEGGDNGVPEESKIPFLVESENMNRGEKHREEESGNVRYEICDYSCQDSVTAQIVEEEGSSNKKRRNEASRSASNVRQKAKRNAINVRKEAKRSASNVRKEAKRDEVRKGKKSQIRPSKHAAAFDWIEEIKEPSYKNYDSSDSDEEPEECEIPIEIVKKAPSEYKDKLIKHLSSPFDKKEYKVLMKKATDRSKKILSKETRNGVRTCETEELSKSYFDWYPDFARAVDKAGKHRRWLLLRGFFFWLLNVGCEGSFKPWVEKSKKDRQNGSSSYKHPNKYSTRCK